MSDCLDIYDRPSVQWGRKPKPIKSIYTLKKGDDLVIKTDNEGKLKLVLKKHSDKILKFKRKTLFEISKELRFVLTVEVDYKEGSQPKTND